MDYNKIASFHLICVYVVFKHMTIVAYDKQFSALMVLKYAPK